MQLFYDPELTTSTSEYQMGPEESRHLIKVLRKNTGDDVLITNGKGFLFKGVIRQVSAKWCMVDIQSSQKEERTLFSLHMAVAPTKMMDRFEWFLEKVTEIGVTEITPLICQRSERKLIRTTRLEKIIESAMKQSLRTYLPVLHPIVPLDDFLKQDRQGQRYMAHCEPGEKGLLTNKVTRDKEITILIGPEGDFTSSEIFSAIQAGFSPISLGKARLRTETAAVVACTAINLLCGN